MQTAAGHFEMGPDESMNAEGVIIRISSNRLTTNLPACSSLVTFSRVCRPFGADAKMLPLSTPTG